MSGLNLLNEVPVTEFESGVIGKDTRKLITKTTDAPFRYICQIRSGPTLDTSSYIGTGFLVGKQSIVTAAHVVFGESPENLFIIPAKNGFGDETKNHPVFFIYFFSLSIYNSCTINRQRIYVLLFQSWRRWFTLCLQYRWVFMACNVQ